MARESGAAQVVEQPFVAHKPHALVALHRFHIGRNGCVMNEPCLAILAQSILWQGKDAVLHEYV